MKLIFKYTWRYKRYLLLSMMGVAGFVLIQMGMPTLLKYIVNDALMGDKPERLGRIALLMLAIVLAGIVGEICMSYANSRIASNVIRDIRSDMFHKTQSFSHTEFDRFSVSALLTSTTSDSYQIFLFVQSMLRSATITPVMTVTGVILILTNNPQMFGAIIIALPLVGFGVFFISKASRVYSKGQQAALDHINLNLREGLSGLRVIRAFGNETFQTGRFEAVNEEYCGVSKRVFRITALGSPFFFLIFNILVGAVLVMGSHAIGRGTLDVGTLHASTEYVFHILFSFLMLATLFIMYPRAAVSAARIQSVLDSTPSIAENLEHGVTETVEKGTVRFENVTFSYQGAGEPVLRNISFTAEKGQTVAFIGSTGSGKSTLIQLIPRMYDVTEGRVLVDGVDVREYNIHALRQKIGFIPQKAQLFTGTIAENLRLGAPDASQEDLERAAEIAQAADIISQKEGGYNAVLQEGGSNLSGGQRQRLAIARAIVKRPELYIFDDSFSALDYMTDLKLRTRLRHDIADATVLIVAQRIGTIRHADKIIVLNEGQIVAEGRHEQLLDTCGIYYDIAVSQLSEEELA